MSGSNKYKKSRKDKDIVLMLIDKSLILNVIKGAMCRFTDIFFMSKQMK